MGVTRGTVLALMLVLVLAACGDGDGIVREPSAAAPRAEVVGFTTADGIELSGFSFGSGDTAVVLAHQQGGGKEQWTDAAVALASNGVRAFAFDFRGYGEQEGVADRMLAEDLTAAVEAMRDDGATRVFVIGASMGGTAALTVAAEEDLAGAVGVSPPVMFAGMDAEQAVADIEEPMLLIVAEDDRDYPEQAATLAEAGGGRVQTFEGSAHGTDILSEHGTELTDLLVRFVTDPEAVEQSGPDTPAEPQEPPALAPTAP